MVQWPFHQNWAPELHLLTAWTDLPPWRCGETVLCRACSAAGDAVRATPALQPALHPGKATATGSWHRKVKVPHAIPLVQYIWQRKWKKLITCTTDSEVREQFPSKATDCVTCRGTKPYTQSVKGSVLTVLAAVVLLSQAVQGICSKFTVNHAVYCRMSNFPGITNSTTIFKINLFFFFFHKAVKLWGFRLHGWQLTQLQPKDYRQKKPCRFFIFAVTRTEYNTSNTCQ